MNAVIRGTGAYTPKKVLTNADFEKIVDTSDEWIVTRTGIKERRIISENESNSDLCLRAGQNALDMAGCSAADLDMIIVGTVTPDYSLPSTAAVVQEKLGAVNSAAFDVVAACAGFLHGLSIAHGFIVNGNIRRALVIGSEVLSRYTDYSDRSTCVLFGDGAGAVVVEAENGADSNGSGVLSSYLKADGSKTELLWIPAGGSKNPLNANNVESRERYIMMSGNEIYKLAVRSMCDAALKALDKAGVSTDQISWLIPHQANIRIIEGVAKRLKIPEQKVFLNIEKYGNTSAASVPIALDEANRKGLLKEGDYILMVAFGGGLTWAASLVRW
jgi:3-oxoacyl-[acyl-carrier-protein] synthase-3